MNIILLSYPKTQVIPPKKNKKKTNYIWKMGSTIKNQCSRHLETNQLICYADQLTGVKMVNAKDVKVTAKIGSNIFLEFWQVLVRFSQN